LASPTRFMLERRPAEPALGGPTLAIVEDTEAVVADTGAARFRMSRGVGGAGRALRSFPFDEVVVAGENVLDSVHSQLLIVQDNDAICGLEIQRISVLERGAIRCCVLLEGTVRTVSGDELLRLTARVHFFAGLPTVRLQLCLTNPNRAKHAGGFWDLGDPGSVILRDVSLELTLPPATGSAAVRCSPEADSPWEEAVLPFELYQDSSGGANWDSPNHVDRFRRVPNTFRGYRLMSGTAARSGLRATPIVAIGQGTRQLAGTLSHFWETFPKAIEVADGSAGCTLTMRLFPRHHGGLHEIQGGEQKTHTIFLSFGPDPVTEQPLEWSRSPALASADPDWVLSTNAVV